MSDHTSAFVPLEAWAFHSPDLRLSDRTVDAGLLAEALIYYDRVVINVSNQPQFAELIRWFNAQDGLKTFFRLIEDGVLQVYDYAFSTTAIHLPSGDYDLMNIQDELQAQANTFERRVLYHPAVRDALDNVRQRNQLYKALRDRVIEVKAADYGAGVQAAREDTLKPSRCSTILQAFVDELYQVLRLGSAPAVNARVETMPTKKHTIYWGLNLDELSQLAGPRINFHRASPITAAAISNRILWSAATLDCDLYLGRPLSALIGDKLFESSLRLDKASKLIDELEARVEFPEIRTLVNDGILTLQEVLKIRGHAKRFRDWLQQEAGRDRDAIIAYHLEVAKESGLQQAGRKTLRLFGRVGGAVTGSVVGTAIAGPTGTAVGAATGSAVGYLTDIASKLGSGWKPVVFGTWLRSRIENALRKEQERTGGTGGGAP